MILYAESSAILSWLLAEAADRRVMGSLEAAEHVVVSDLLFVECDRALIRSVTLGALPRALATSAAQQLARVSEHWQVLRLSPSILGRSRQPFPLEPVRSLDALHLASALGARSALPEIAVLSLDQSIRSNASELGFVVYPDVCS